jgi:hypothetical protein
MKVGFARSFLAGMLTATSTILPPRFGQVSKMQLAPQLTNGIRLLHRAADGILLATPLPQSHPAIRVPGMIWNISKTPEAKTLVAPTALTTSWSCSSAHELRIELSWRNCPPPA